MTIEQTERVFLFGSHEPTPPAHRLTAGDMSALIQAGALRALTVGGIEVIRQIDFPVRDENWASLSVTTLSQSCSEDANGFQSAHHFSVADGALECNVTYAATHDGLLTATGTATAKRDFVTNRTGFSVLHPLCDFAGRPATVHHSDGSISQTHMPDIISPSQPIKDIKGLQFDLDGMTLDIRFEGEVFEMEDQRNWSDASYKTYCRPLVEPFAYTIRAGETLRQKIEISVSGAAPPAPPAPARDLVFDFPDQSALPELSLAVEDGWIANEQAVPILRQSGLRHLLVRVTPDTAATLIPRVTAQAEALQASVDIEIVLQDDVPAAAQVARIAQACHSAQLSPKHVIALPRAFLTSYQPSSQWPEGLQPEDGFAAVQAAFPDARIGAGMLTNFTELNRRPPRGLLPDFITHGNSATVHAADDSSVMQTLETLPHIFRSAQAIAGGCAYRLGLTAIGMRTNPYGAKTSPNPDQRRLTMSVWDPRARAMVGAAWAVGALAATQGHQVDAICFAAPTGPFGIISTPADVTRPWYDDHPDAQVYPIFHVLRALSAGRQRLALDGVPHGLAGVAIKTATQTRLVLANLTDSERTVSLPQGQFASLDAQSFADAALNAEWLDTAWRPTPPQPHQLAPYAILFADV